MDWAVYPPPTIEAGRLNLRTHFEAGMRSCSTKKAGRRVTSICERERGFKTDMNTGLLGDQLGFAGKEGLGLVFLSPLPKAEPENID